MKLRSWFLVAASVFALTATGAAHAQGVGSAEAEELFQQGRAALDARDYPAACAKFDASLQLEPAVGTLMSLAECQEEQGQLARARQHWQEAADLAEAKNDPLRRGEYGRQRFARVDARVPRLLVRLATGAPKDATLRRDGVALGTAVFGVDLPLDPGAHVLAVSAPGRETRQYSVELQEGEHKAIEVWPGEERARPPVAASPTVAPRPSVVEEPPAPGGAARVTSGSRHWRTIAYVVGGIGLVGIGIGTYLGTTAFSEWNAASDLCPCAGTARETATQHKTTAQNDATASTIAFAAGGAAVVAGVVAWLALGSDPHAEIASRVELAPAVDLHGAAFTVRGSW